MATPSEPREPVRSPDASFADGPRMHSRGLGIDCLPHFLVAISGRAYCEAHYLRCTTNLIERLFGEERRRLKIVPNAFGEKPVLKLMFGALIRAAESWRGLRFTEFELRQLDAVRKELDADYETSIARSDRSSRPRVSSKSAP